MNFQITPGDDSVSQHIEDQLLKDLRQQRHQSENTQLIFTATNKTGILLGGVTAHTAYSWLHIKTLWVHEEHRRNGIASGLIHKVESAGHDAGCHSAWLDTSNPCAKVFYDKLGYLVFGELRNNSEQLPASHTRWFMKKMLGESSEA